MSFIICGIPKNDEGKFFCPYCKFTSSDIEQFATSMCWDCALPAEEEENMVFSFRDVKVGDTVTLETTFVVSNTDMYEGALYGKDLRGRKFPVTNDVTFYRNGGRHTFDIKNVKHPEPPKPKNPEHWPVQVGDVWADSDGEEYHVLMNGTTLKIFTSRDKIIYEAELKANPGIKLVHRMGNKS